MYHASQAAARRAAAIAGQPHVSTRARARAAVRRRAGGPGAVQEVFVLGLTTAVAALALIQLL